MKARATSKAAGWSASGAVFADGKNFRFAVQDSGFAVVQGNNGNLSPFSASAVFDGVRGLAAYWSTLSGGCKATHIPEQVITFLQAANLNCFDPANQRGSVSLAATKADVYEQSLFSPGSGGFNLTQATKNETNVILLVDVFSFFVRLSILERAGFTATTALW